MREDDRDLDPVPPDLANVHRRLVVDGAAWQHTIPDPQKLIAFSRQLPEVPSGAPSLSRQNAPANIDPEQRKSTVNRSLRVIAPLTVSLVIVVLLGVIFSHFRSSSGSAAHPGSTTATGVARGTWVVLSRLNVSTDFGATSVPAVAPSNPNVVYETLASNGQAHLPAELRQTADNGQTWQDLPLPVAADHIYGFSVAVSPIDANNVFLIIFDDEAVDCPVDRQIPNYEGGIGVDCWLTYVSVNGGQQWTLAKLPSVSAKTPTTTLGSFSSQGQRLFARSSCSFDGCDRLVTSTDRGLTWAFADPGTSSGSICNYTAATSGGLVFVATRADCNFLVQQPVMLWMSKDSGATWTRQGTLPTPNIKFDTSDLAWAPNSSGPLGTLYLADPTTIQISKDKTGGDLPILSQSASDVYASQDGGVTWTHAPTQGIPTGYEAMFDINGVLGPLNDGSVIAEFVKAQPTPDADFAGSTLYTWKPGDAAWHQLAPPLALSIGSLFVIPSADLLGTIYIVQVDRSGQPKGPTYSVLKIDP